jgi:hypothetical protein
MALATADMKGAAGDCPAALYDQVRLETLLANGRAFRRGRRRRCGRRYAADVDAATLGGVGVGDVRRPNARGVLDRVGEVAFSFVLANFGIAIAAKMPMMTTTINYSISVKPLRFI